MKHQRIAITTGRLERLRSEILSTPASDVVAAHLSADEFVHYSLDALSSEEMDKIDLHLEACPDCLTQIERLLSAAEEWESPQAIARFKQKQAEILKVVPAQD